MTLTILNAIREKRQTFPLLNKSVIENHVSGILRNFREIKGRNYNRSVIYRQVSRDDYPQPSFIEQFFDFWAASSFRSEIRGQALIAEVDSWNDWRKMLDPQHMVAPRDFWELEHATDAMFSQVRRCHMHGDVYEERSLLLQIRENVGAMLKLTGVGEVPADARFTGE